MNSTTHHFKIRLENKSEDTLKCALLLLPACAPEHVAGFRAAVDAHERYRASKLAAEEAEKYLKVAMSKLRDEVNRQWKQAEIPAETHDLLYAF